MWIDASGRIYDKNNEWCGESWDGTVYFNQGKTFTIKELIEVLCILKKAGEQKRMCSTFA